MDFNDVVSTYDYEQLREKIYSIRYYLNKCITALSEVDGNLTMCCNIDDSAVENLKVSTIINDLRSRVNYLNYTIIPSINSKINS